MSKCHSYPKDYIYFEDKRFDVVLTDLTNSGGCKYKAFNPNKKLLACVKVEEGVMQNVSGKKCDYLLLICSEKAAVFIELKGQDFAHAMTQLNESIRHLYPPLRQAGFKKCRARIILTKRKNTQYNSNPKWLKLKKTIDVFDVDFSFHMEKKTDKL